MSRYLALGVLLAASALAGCGEGSPDPLAPPINELSLVGSETDLDLVFQGGQGLVTEFQITSPITGELSRDVRTNFSISKLTQVGQCCVDTAISVSLPGTVSLGTSVFAAPTIVVKTMPVTTMHPDGTVTKSDQSLAFATTDGADVRLVVWGEGPLPSRELIQSGPATLEVLEISAPSLGKDGSVRARIDFLATPYVREFAPNPSLRPLDQKVRVRVAFSQPMKYDVHVVKRPPRTSAQP